MIREASAMDVRNNLGELLNGVQYRRDSVVISKAGKPVAALIDSALFARIRKLDAEFLRLTDKLAAPFTDASDTEIDALVDEAVKAARKN